MAGNYRDKIHEAKQLFEKAKEMIGGPGDAQDAEQVEELMVAGRKLMAQAGQLKEIEEAALQAKVTEIENKQPQTVEPESGEFKGWDEFLLSAWRAQVDGQTADPRLVYIKNQDVKKHEAKTGMAANVGATGGFLVPSEFLAQLHAVTAEDVIVRPRATIIRMRRRQIDIPVLDQTGTSSGYGHWFGGMRFYWTEEAADKSTTEPTFRQVSLVAHKLVGLTYASDELLDDSAISLGDFLSGPLGFAGGIAFNEDMSFINGTGAGQPLGVINAGCTITVNRAAVGTPIQYADLVNMYESFLPSGRGLWTLNQSCISNLLTVVDTVGNYLWLPNVQHIPGAPPNQLFGFPVQFVEKQPRVGSAGDVLLADWKYYLIGDRQQATVETTNLHRWQYDQTSWRVVHRVDGQPWLSTYLTYQDGTTSVSPFVILGAKST